MGFGPLGIPTSLEPLLGFSQAALLQWDIKVTPPGHYFSVACDSEVVGTVIGRCTIVCDVPVVTSFMLSKKKVLSPPDQPQAATECTCLRRVCCASPPGLGACSRPISQHTRLRSMARRAQACALRLAGCSAHSTSWPCRSSAGFRPIRRLA